MRVLAREMSARIQGVRLVLGTNDLTYDRNRLADTPLDIRQNYIVPARSGRGYRLLHRFMKHVPGHWTPVVPLGEIRRNTEMMSSDLVVFTGGDHFCYSFQNTLSRASRPLAARAAGIPVAIYSASFNQLKSEYQLDYLKFFLDELDYISIRERYSLETVQTWDLRTPIELVSDPAFLLEPLVARSKAILDAGRLELSGDILGITVSSLSSIVAGVDIVELFRHMAYALDRFAVEYNYQVLLIPHVSAIDALDTRYSDRMACLLLRGLMARADRCSVLMGEYSAAELKGVISRCNLFCGFRTHSTIAAVSSHVPTLFVAYSSKAYGIARDLHNSDRWCLNIADITEELFFDRLAQLHCERDAVADGLRNAIPGMQERARKGIDSLCRLLRDDRTE